MINTKVGKELKREKTKAGKTTVNGKPIFENGKLTKPGGAMEEIKKTLKKKLKKRLPEVDEKYQELGNIQYIQDEVKRKEYIQILDEFLEKENVLVKKINNHDTVVKCRGRIVLKLCPLRKSFSSSIMGVNDGQIQRYTKAEIIQKTKEALARIPKKPVKASTIRNDEEVIADLEKRIAIMSEGSKGVKLARGTYSKAVKDWASKNGYTISGETVFVNKV